VFYAALTGMAWVALIAAGLFETAFAVSLKPRLPDWPALSH
jgi:hypothetical protein